PYADYKESGLPWLGEVPSHWTVLPAFGAFKPNKARNIGMKEKTVLSLSYGRIVIKPAEKLHGLVPESFETYQIVDPGDSVLRTTDLQNDHTSLRVGMVRDRGIITSAYLALRALPGVSPDYGFQFLNVWDSSKAIYGYGSGLRQSLDFSHFKRMPIAIPPPAEQAAIVCFLDWANGRLERAIRAKRKVIALLNEQKQAIIHRAVTRGLDPSVALKPSGLPWLGEIPEHWEFRQVRRVALFVTSGSRGWADYYSDSGLVFIQSGNLGRNMALNFHYIQHVQPPSGSEGERTRVLTDDLLICITGALTGNVVHVDADLPGPSFVNQHVALVRLGQSVVQSRFLAFSLRSGIGQSQMKTSEYGGTKQGLGLGDVKDIYFPLPPRDEQQKIVVHLDATLAVFNSAISRLEREIDFLREYRTRLVADVVTGKLDVREAATRLPNEELLPDLAAADDEHDDLAIEEEADA
ncbi:MAG: restriction endonuclease subunit S, partial [Cyanobacteria bacterium]|nr:restriction endonuclease subunit S [Cyanobacteriota bacterium]